MNPNAEKLFEYLKDIIYNPDKARLNLDELDPDFLMLGKGLVFFGQSVIETNNLAASLSRGDLSVSLPSPENEMAAPLKALHASLRHITWQSQQVAKGDYKQHMDFMGEFSESFNLMIRQLDTRQQALLREIEISREKTRALEQAGALMVDLAERMPQCLVVLEETSRDILFANNAVKAELDADIHFLDKLVLVIAENEKTLDDGQVVEFIHTGGGVSRYMSISSYSLQWGVSKAKAFTLSDVSDEHRRRQELEEHAYKDELTGLYNRHSGMETLSAWLEENRQFVLIFIDLNSLKYVNDTFGHGEGDHYIITAARQLEHFSLDARVCRIGGDEFMILAPDLSQEEATNRMEDLGEGLERICNLESKPYIYSISYGVVQVNPGNTHSASKLLQTADERMYRHKRLVKAQMQNPVPE